MAHKMMDSEFGSATLPVIQLQPAGDGGPVTPTVTNRGQGTITIVQANLIPLRVVVANTSIGGDAWFTFDAASLQRWPYGQGVFQLQAGKSETFVLAPGQRLLGAAPQADTTISWHVSEAYPEQ